MTNYALEAKERFSEAIKDYCRKRKRKSEVQKTPPAGGVFIAVFVGWWYNFTVNL